MRRGPGKDESFTFSRKRLQMDVAHFYSISSLRISHIISFLSSVFSLQKRAGRPADNNVDPGPCLFFLLKSGLITPASVKSLLQAAGYGVLSCSGQIIQCVHSGDCTVLKKKMVEIVLISAVFHFFLKNVLGVDKAASVQPALDRRLRKCNTHCVEITGMERLRLVRNRDNFPAHKTIIWPQNARKCIHHVVRTPIQSCRGEI